MPGQLTAQDVAAAARRAALTMAQDPTMRFYAPDVLALVLERTVVNMAGAGSLERVAERLAEDPQLADVPIDVLDGIVNASFQHFARALGRVDA